MSEGNHLQLIDDEGGSLELVEIKNMKGEEVVILCVTEQTDETEVRWIVSQEHAGYLAEVFRFYNTVGVLPETNEKE